MGLLDRVIRKSAERPRRIQLVGGQDLRIVGEAKFQAALERACGGRTYDGHNMAITVRLVPEPMNPHDRNAVRVDFDGQTIGYLKRTDALVYQPVLLAQGRNVFCECEAVIRGGWDRGGGDTGHFGVALNIAQPDGCVPK